MSTMKDLANKTGLSLGTISKYINGGKIREENRIILDNAVNDLNFTVNEFAQGLRTNKSKTVGIIIPSLKGMFTNILISRIEDILYENGYSTIVCDYKEDRAIEQSKLDFVCSKQVSGIIMIPSGDSAELRRKLNHVIQTKHIPAVLVDRVMKGVKCDAVVTDNLDMSYEVTRTLLEQGHKRIGIIVGDKRIYTSKKRLEGYHMAHADMGRPIDEACVRFGDYYMGSGYECCLKILEMPDRPTAIIASNHDMMHGALIAIVEKGISIPDDISFVGYDNADIAKLFKPQISVVLQPIDKMGDAAANLILSKMQGGDVSATNICFYKSTFHATQSIGKL